MAGKSSFGGTIKLQGESEYRKALKDITSNLTVLSSEMKVVTSQYDKNDKSAANLSQQNEVLTKKIDNQKEKVRVLKQALEDSKKETGEYSDTTKKWQTALNNAEAELNKLDKELDDNTKSIKDFDNSTKDASQSTLKLGDIIKANLISDAIKGGLSALVDGMKKLGSAMVDVGKQALGSYADYEQLIGGVETLFGDSANVVEGYANNAYKTAGLSANEYMETVTSFSASLLQSLNGDTAKSAEVADMAITDMADNANKMGTSMDSIQNAYQGFAKQNYTMLDNLKLGYGGTKSEMERLLADAEKISGVKYDISNLNDVYSAIHVIQTEIGITGTTQKEASQTISGSIASMKSAYSNFLTGLANGNADMGQLITNLVDSVITAGDNILPVVDQIASSVMEVLPELLNNIIEHLPQFLEAGTNILNSLISGIQNNLPAIMNAVMQIVTTLVNTLIQNLPQILQMGIQIIVSLIQGIAQELPTLIPQIIDAVILMTETLIDNIDLIIDAGIQLIIGLAEGLIEALPRLIEEIPVIIEKLIMAITDNLPKIIEMGITLIIKLGIGLIKAIPQLISNIPKIITAMVKGFANYLSNMAEVGKNLVKGIWNGIKDATSWILDKIKGFGKSILKGIKSIFGIHSPSTLFRDEVGKNLALGIGEGFEDEMANVNRDIQNALPTDFDLSSNVSLNSALSNQNNGEMKYYSMVDAFKQALKEVKIELNDEVAANFVDDTVRRVVYS